MHGLEQCWTMSEISRRSTLRGILDCLRNHNSKMQCGASLCPIIARSMPYVMEMYLPRPPHACEWYSHWVSGVLAIIYESGINTRTVDRHYEVHLARHFQMSNNEYGDPRSRLINGVNATAPGSEVAMFVESSTQPTAWTMPPSFHGCARLLHEPTQLIRKPSALARRCSSRARAHRLVAAAASTSHSSRAPTTAVLPPGAAALSFMAGLRIGMRFSVSMGRAQPNAGEILYPTLGHRWSEYS